MRPTIGTRSCLHGTFRQRDATSPANEPTNKHTDLDLFRECATVELRPNGRRGEGSLLLAEERDVPGTNQHQPSRECGAGFAHTTTVKDEQRKQKT